jgi:hypothetical protein
MSLMRKLVGFLFDRRHPNLSRVFTINQRSYQVCCDYGAEFDYSVRTMPARRIPLKRPSCSRFTRL